MDVPSGTGATVPPIEDLYRPFQAHEFSPDEQLAIKKLVHEFFCGNETPEYLQHYNPLPAIPPSRLRQGLSSSFALQALYGVFLEVNAQFAAMPPPGLTFDDMDPPLLPAGPRRNRRLYTACYNLHPETLDIAPYIFDHSPIDPDNHSSNRQTLPAAWKKIESPVTVRFIEKLGQPFQNSPNERLLAVDTTFYPFAEPSLRCAIDPGDSERLMKQLHAMQAAKVFILWIQDTLRELHPLPSPVELPLGGTARFQTSGVTLSQLTPDDAIRFVQELRRAIIPGEPIFVGEQRPPGLPQGESCLLYASFYGAYVEFHARDLGRRFAWPEGIFIENPSWDQVKDCTKWNAFPPGSHPTQEAFCKYYEQNFIAWRVATLLFRNRTFIWQLQNGERMAEPLIDDTPVYPPGYELAPGQDLYED